MKSSKVKAILMSTLMAASMMIAPMSAMAETPTASAISKTVLHDSNVTVPSTTYSFTFTQKFGKNADSNTDQPANDITPVQATGTGTYSATADFSTLTSALKAKGLAGEYTFTLTEDKLSVTDPAAPFGWTNDVDTKTGVAKTTATSYTVRAYVDKDLNVNYTMFEGADRADAAEVDKLGSATFTNKFTKPANMTVKKEVPQNDTQYENKDQEYTFTVTFTKDSNSYNPDSTIKSNVALNDGKIVANTAVDYGTYTFKLKNGETATFTDVPVGTTYTVSEDTTALKNVTTTYTVDGIGGQPNNTAIKETGNAVVVTNDYTDITVTGVVTSIAPFIALIAIAVVAVAVYMGMKKKIAR